MGSCVEVVDGGAAANLTRLADRRGAIGGALFELDVAITNACHRLRRKNGIPSHSHVVLMKSLE